MAFEEALPGLGQAQQAQRVAGGGSVEDNMVIAVGIARQQTDELVEGGDLRGAGAGELLAHGAAFGVRALSRHLCDHAHPVGLGRDVGIDVQRIETWRTGHGARPVRQPDAQHLVEVGGGVGADQQHAFAGVGECRAQAQASEVLPTPPLPVKNRKRGGSCNSDSGAEGRVFVGSVMRPV